MKTKIPFDFVFFSFDFAFHLSVVTQDMSCNSSERKKVSEKNYTQKNKTKNIIIF